MSQVRTCPNGHQWETPAGLPAVHDADTVCPVCSSSGGVRIPPPVALPAGPPPEIEGYEVLGELGRGGMGVVYKARDLRLQRVVALKMIRDGVLAGPDDVARFRAEAEAVARLQHPNVVQIHDVGEQNGRPYFALEYLEGDTLARKTAGTALPARQAAELVETLARAMHAVHQKHVLHRDLKPANVLLTADGTPKITDFGLAKKLDEAGQTTTGTVMGTPSYMAPEQARGEKGLTPAVDVYALGATLYDLLTGRPPFVGPTAVDTMLQVLSRDPLPPAQLQPQVPRDLESICLKCLHKEPRRRYASAQALADDLRRFLDGKATIARPVGRVVRLQRWCQRNPVVAGLLAALLTAIVLGAGFGTWQVRNYLKEKEDKDQEQTAKLKAQEDAANKMRDYLKEKEDKEQEQGAKLKAQDEAARQQEGKIQALGEKAAAEELAKKEAEKRADVEKRTNAELALHLYFRQVAAAEREWLANNVGRARDLLAACPPELRNWEWQYVNRLCHADQITLPLPARAMRVTFTSGDARLGAITAAGGPNEERIARFWDWQADPPHEVQTVPLPAGTEEAVVSPDGKHLALLSSGEVTLWDCAGGKTEHTFRLARPRRVAFSRDGKLLAAGGETVRGADDKERAEIHVWDAHSGDEVCTLPGHSSSIDALAFSPDGKRLASGSGNLEKGEVKVWELEGKKELLTFDGHSSQVYTVAFSPDGKRIASGGYDRTVKVWDAQTGQEQLTLGGHINAVTSVAFSPNGQRIATGSWDQSLKVWNAHNGVEEFTLRGHAKEVSAVAFSPDGLYLASASWDGTVKLWDVAHSNPAVVMQLAGGAIVSGLAYHPRGRRLAAAARVGDTVVLWHPGMGVPFESFTGRECVAYSPDGKLLAAAVEDKDEHFVKVWDVAERKEVCTLRGHEGEIKAVAFSPDGKRVVTGGQDRTVRIWDALTGAEDRTWSGHSSAVTSVAFCPDGRHVVSGSFDKTVRVWDANGRGEPRVLEHTFPVRGVAVDRDGRSIAAATGDYEVPGEVWLWDAGTGKKLLALRGHTDQVNAVAFSPDGTRIASASHDKSVKLWDATSGQEAFTLRPFAGAVLAVTFSADGRHIATGTWTGEVKDWDAAPPGAATGPDDPARKAFVAWFKANSKDGPRSKFVRDMTGLVDEEVYEGNNVTLTFGSDNLRSGKATEACLFAGRFFTFELSEEQAKQLEVEPGSVKENAAKRQDHTETPLLAELSAAKIDGADSLDGGKKITGRIACHTLAQGKGKVALRLSYRGPDGNVAAFHYLDKDLPDDQGTLDFSFSPLHEDGDKPYTGPLVLFIDLCTVIDRKEELPEVVLHSNTVGALVQVTAK